MTSLFPEAPRPLVLRPLQERAVAALRAALRRTRYVLLVAPTGFGKTTTSSELIRRAASRLKRVLFIVHRREIVRATAKRLRRGGIACGVLMADEPPPAGELVLVCSIQTLAARKLFPPADLIFWDEAHHCTAESYRTVAAAYPDALHVGLTATPERSDGTALGDVFKEMVVGASTAELVAADLLVPCDVIAPDRRLDGLAWPVLETWQTHAAGRRTVVFAASVAHAQALAAEFMAAGVLAACVHEKTSKGARDRALELFERGEVTVLVNVFCLTEGWDCPPAEVCVLARGCGSPGTFLQMIGRVLRTAPGKSRALLIDHYGVVHEHGVPEDEREFSLDGKPIRNAAKATPLRQCPQCGATFRPCPTCPRCAYAFPPPPPPDVKGVAMAFVKKTATRREKLDAWTRLCMLGHARGYKPGWAGCRFKEEFGHWPSTKFPRYHDVIAARDPAPRAVAQ